MDVFRIIILFVEAFCFLAACLIGLCTMLALLLGPSTADEEAEDEARLRECRQMAEEMGRTTET